MAIPKKGDIVWCGNETSGVFGAVKYYTGHVLAFEICYFSEQGIWASEKSVYVENEENVKVLKAKEVMETIRILTKEITSKAIEKGAKKILDSVFAGDGYY